jgi:pimeloyl-ACP methyl ester carboxylesterase
MWDRLVADSADRWRCWAVDLTGFGATSLPADEMHLSVDYHVESLIQFCDEHELRPRAIIGHSMGGLVTLKLALARPDLAEKLVLMCPVVTGRTGVYFSMFDRVFKSPLRRFIRQNGDKALSLAQTDAVASLYQLTSPDKATQKRKTDDVKRMQWRAAIDSLETLAQPSMEASLAQIEQPALVIIGTRDYTVPPAEGRLAAKNLPNAMLIEYRGGLHHPLDEDPERTVKSVRVFLGF